LNTGVVVTKSRPVTNPRQEWENKALQKARKAGDEGTLSLKLVGRRLPSVASSIGIIGGAHGPTAIFFTGGDVGRGKTTGMRGLPLHSCVSIPAFSENEPARFMIEGIDIQEHDSATFQFGDLE